MDCCDCCTYTEDTSYVTDATYVAQEPAATDVVVEFPPLDTGTAVTLPAESPTDWGLTPAATAPAPSIPYADPIVQSMANDMYIDVMNKIDIPMMNLTSPYGPDYTATYDSTTNSTGWVKDGDLTPSTPTTSSYDD